MRRKGQDGGGRRKPARERKPKMKRAEIDMVEVAKMLDKMVEENDANQIIGAAKMLSLFGWSVRRENGGWIFKPTK